MYNVVTKVVGRHGVAKDKIGSEMAFSISSIAMVRITNDATL